MLRAGGYSCEQNSLGSHIAYSQVRKWTFKQIITEIQLYAGVNAMKSMGCYEKEGVIWFIDINKPKDIKNT